MPSFSYVAAQELSDIGNHFSSYYKVKPSFKTLKLENEVWVREIEPGSLFMSPWELMKSWRNQIWCTYLICRGMRHRWDCWISSNVLISLSDERWSFCPQPLGGLEHLWLHFSMCCVNVCEHVHSFTCVFRCVNGFSNNRHVRVLWRLKSIYETKIVFLTCQISQKGLQQQVVCVSVTWYFSVETGSRGINSTLRLHTSSYQEVATFTGLQMNPLISLMSQMADCQFTVIIPFTTQVRLVSHLSENSLLLFTGCVSHVNEDHGQWDTPLVMLEIRYSVQTQSPIKVCVQMDSFCQA